MAKQESLLEFGLVDRVSKGLHGIADAVGGISGKLLKLTGIAGAAGAALGVVGTGFGLKNAISAAGDFEDAVARIGVATNSTGAELEALGDKAEAAAAKTRFTAEDAAKGLAALAAEGFNANEAVGALGPTLALAQANAISATEGVAALTGVMDQFGLGASEAARAADVLQAAAINGGTKLSDLTAGLEQAGPVARQAGLSLEQTAAALAAFAQNGIEGSRAGGALRQILSDLADPASQFARELAKIGISSRDFNTVIAQLAAKGKDGEAAINALGSRGTIALKSLLANGGGALQELIGIMQSSEGAAQAAADKLNNTFNGAMERVKNAFADLKRALVEPLLEPLAQELDGATEALRKFATSPEFDALKETLRTLFLEGIKAVKEFAAQFDIKVAIGNLRTTLGEAQAVIRTFAADAAALASSIKVAFNGIAAAFNAVQTAAAATAVLGAKLDLLRLQVLDPFKLTTAEAQLVLEDFIRHGLEETGRQADQLIGNISALTENVDNTADAASRAAEAYKRTADFTNVLAQSSSTAAAAVQQAAGALAETGTQATTASGAMESAAVQLQRVSTEIAEAAAAGIAPTKAQIEQLRALEQQAVATGSTVQSVWEKASEIYRGAEAATQKVATATQQVQQNVEATGDAAVEMGQQIAAGSEQGASAAAGIAGLIQQLYEGFAQVSLNAAETFATIERSAVRGESSIRGVIAAILNAADATQRIIDNQRAQASAIVGNLQAMAAAGSEAARGIGANFDRLTEEQLRAFSAAIRRGETDLGILDQASLDRLATEADAAADRVRRIGEEARQAKAELDSLANSLADEVARAEGNEEELARRNYEERIRQLEELGRRSGIEGQQRLEEARANANRLYQLELEQIRRRREAERKANAETLAERQQIAGVGSDPAPQRSAPARSSGGGQSARVGESQRPGGDNIQITINRSSGRASNDELRDEARRLIAEIDRQRNLRR